MTVARFARVEGIRVESIGDEWAAWSPLSGETHVLNHESAAILEVLDESGPLQVSQAAGQLAGDVRAAAAALETPVRLALLALEHAGFVLRLDNAGP